MTSSALRNALLIALFSGWLAPCALAVPGGESAADDADEVKAEFAAEESNEGELAEVPVDFKAVLTREQYRFTPAVRDAYVQSRKQQAQAAFKAMGKTIPDEFMAWVDSDPVVRSTVYGSPNPANVLLVMYSLSLDVGEHRFKRYRNWLLAAAVKNAGHAAKADVTKRPPMKLVIPGDPRRPVDTKDANRQLDQNDHIINFLEDNKIVASDVMYNSDWKKKITIDWQKKFNDYMAAKRMPARVDCSMKLGTGTPKQKKPRLKKVMDAYRLLQTAYEEKGRIPKQKEPRIGLAQWVVLQVDNHEAGKSRSHFPLDQAPWPVLTALLNPRLSLREAYNMNNAPNPIPDKHYKLNAFNTEMLKAVDVRPFPYHEGSWFMIKKHGGACGTRAMLAANQNKAYGLPSSPVGEIGHASWVEFDYYKKGNRYGMRFQGGGHNPATLSIHTALPISRGRIQEKASNWGAFLDAIQGRGGVASYMESMMAYYVIQSLTKEERAQYGAQLKADALAIHPGNLMLSNTITSNAAESAVDRRKERWRKQHAGELLRKQREEKGIAKGQKNKSKGNTKGEATGKKKK